MDVVLCIVLTIIVVERCKLKKKLKYIFVSIISILLLAMAIHVAITYVSLANDPYTSAPARIAFVLIIPYALVIGIVSLVWIILSKKHKEKRD